MKALFCVAFLGLGALVTFLFQKAKLETLRQESHALEGSVRERAADEASPVSDNRSRRNQCAGASSEEPVERLGTMVNRSFEMLLTPDWNRAQHAEFEMIRNKVILGLVKIDHRSAFRILNQALEIPDISQDQRDRLIEGYVRIYTDANPLEALRLFELLPDYPELAKQLIKAYERTAIASPGHAVAWFEEQSRNGKPVAGNPEIIRASLTAQSRTDPTRAVARMSELTDQEEMKILGFSVFQELRNVNEHLAFSGALENELAKDPASSALPEIRASYVKALTSRLDDWPFEEAVLLIDGCLTPEAKLEVASKLAFLQNEQDAEKWAGWLATMEVADNRTHPLPGFIGRWTLSDPAVAMNWIENIASGAARERGIIGFANYMAENDPRNGLRLLNTLPESEERSNTIQRVRERWRKVDPTAEAGYQAKGG